MAMVGAYITGKTVDGYSTPPAYLCNGEFGGYIQFQSRTILRFRLRPALSVTVMHIHFQNDISVRFLLTGVACILHYPFNYGARHL